MTLEQAVERCEDFSRGLACARHQGLGQALTLVLAAAKRPEPVYALGEGERKELQEILNPIKERLISNTAYQKIALGSNLVWVSEAVEEDTRRVRAITAALNLAPAPSVLSDEARHDLEKLREYHSRRREDKTHEYQESCSCAECGRIVPALSEALSLSPPFTRSELKLLKAWRDTAWRVPGAWSVAEDELTAKLDAYLETKAIFQNKS